MVFIGIVLFDCMYSMELICGCSLELYCLVVCAQWNYFVGVHWNCIVWLYVLNGNTLLVFIGIVLFGCNMCSMDLLCGCSLELYRLVVICAAQRTYFVDVHWNYIVWLYVLNGPTLWVFIGIVLFGCMCSMDLLCGCSLKLYCLVVCAQWKYFVSVHWNCIVWLYVRNETTLWVFIGIVLFGCMCAMELLCGCSLELYCLAFPMST